MSFAGFNAWLGRECPACKAPPGHDCKPDRGDGAIHGQRTVGPCYPHGRPSPEQLEAIEARRAARRADLAKPTTPNRVEPVQLDLLTP